MSATPVSQKAVEHPSVDSSGELQLKRILVPTDFSESSERALKYAVRLGAPYKAEVVLLHVFHLKEYLGLLSQKEDIDSATANQVLDASKIGAIEKLEELLRRVDGKAVVVLPILLIGVPFEEIVRYAGEHETDLIVMPTHGRTGLAHFLLGSTTERVISHSACPVLVIRTRPGEGA
ncbi:MAG TPA: universal stress protein [Chthoniobacterales bacterium]|nr:universal stress protein [Chthoniobacterales bacterium]